MTDRIAKAIEALEVAQGEIIGMIATLNVRDKESGRPSTDYAPLKQITEALEALRQPSPATMPPDAGFVLAPVEPTKKMISAAAGHGVPFIQQAVSVYKAMLAAAPAHAHTSATRARGPDTASAEMAEFGDLPELLPCPMCDGKIELRNTGSATSAGHDVAVSHINANKRNCILDELYLGREDKAAGLWNTRARPAPSADVKELLRKIILAAPFYKLFPPTEAQEQEAAMECKKARLALLEAFRQQTWAEAIALCREVRDGVAAPQTKIGTEYCIDALERALTPLERKEG